MGNKDIGTIEMVQNIRDVWPKEDADFTPWLCEHIDVVGKCIQRNLHDAQKEANTGSYFVDIVAKDDNEDSVIIENQYGKSDHDHLGKLLTYANSISDVKTAVWIVELASEEHVKAITALNEHYDGCDFFLLKLQAIKIDGSKPAPILTKLSGPDESTETVKFYNKRTSEKEHKFIRFWTRFIELCKKNKYTPFIGHNPSKGGFMTAGTGIAGFSYECWTNKASVWIELRLDSPEKERNSVQLQKIKKQLELSDKEYHDSLTWVDNDETRMSSIRMKYEGGGFESTGDELDSTIMWCIDNLRKLEQSTRKYLK